MTARTGSRQAVPLIIPGLFNSGPDHWQTRWQALLPGAQRVHQHDWENPVLADWLAQLGDHIARIDGPVVLIGHSLGCITALYQARLAPQRIAAALLVAPADVERDTAPAVIRHFSPVPLDPLPFPVIVVASADDPYCGLERSQQFAAAWGSELVVLPQAGHINGDSGLGDWPQGLALLERLQHLASA